MSIRSEIAELVEAAARAAQAAGDIPPVVLEDLAIERPSRPEHGDYASSLPLRLARTARKSPIALAEILAKHMPAAPGSRRGDGGAARLRQPAPERRLADARRSTTCSRRATEFASSDVGGGKKVQVEFVSANPTGPLHVGNGRWASIGDSLARVLAAAGYQVEKEYLINDAGTQSTVFGNTVFARYQQAFGKDVALPDGGYPGDYVIELAEEIKTEYGDKFLAATEAPEELATHRHREDGCAHPGRPGGPGHRLRRLVLGAHAVPR